MSSAQPWRVSLHGGHSSDYCDHAHDDLRAILQAAVAAGYHTFGISEHVPRTEPYLYYEERERGWTADKVADDFARYALQMPVIAEEYADRLTVMRGFEAEVVPPESYAARMIGYRQWKQPDGMPVFDYFVGSVHHVNGIQIDGHTQEYVRAVESCGGIEALAMRYYETVTEMIETLHPDVVAHLDLVKRNARAAGYDGAPLASPRVRAAAEAALQAARASGSILDLNLAGWRKGLQEPYPAPWLTGLANEMGLPFCFGDDSHRVGDVGNGLEAGRDYLRQQDVRTVTVLTRDQGHCVRRIVSLE